MLQFSDIGFLTKDEEEKLFGALASACNLPLEYVKQTISSKTIREYIRKKKC